MILSLIHLYASSTSTYIRLFCPLMLQIQDEMVKSYMNTDDKKLKGYLNNACYIVPLFSRTNSLKYI